LTASVAPNIVAYNAGVTLIDDVDRPTFMVLTIQWTIFCMLMQLGTNLHNDYADFVKGADTEKRVGQPRATQKGWLTPEQTATTSAAFLGVGLCLGTFFIRAILTAQRGDGIPAATIMGFIVISSIFNAFAYTGGPWPMRYIGLENFSIGYSGLGDLFAFLYFGLVATMTLPFLYIVTTAGAAAENEKQLLEVLRKFVPYAVQVAVLVTNIIVVNNLRDRHTDVLVDKKTLAVRFGSRFCHLEYLTNLEVAYGIVICQAFAVLPSSSTSNISAILLLPLLSLPLAYKEWRAVCTKEGSALNEHVGGAAKVQILFCILLSISIRIASNNR
jgi:1,4-dihydroxy-2-naphthoate octaprenyltransferase